MLTVARYGTRDLPRARSFYDAITALLGASRVIDREEVVGYRGAAGGMFLVGRPYAACFRDLDGNKIMVYRMGSP